MWLRYEWDVTVMWLILRYCYWDMTSIWLRCDEWRRCYWLGWDITDMWVSCNCYVAEMWLRCHFDVTNISLTYDWYRTGVWLRCVWDHCALKWILWHLSRSNLSATPRMQTTRMENVSLLLYEMWYFPWGRSILVVAPELLLQKEEHLFEIHWHHGMVRCNRDGKI